MANVFRVNTLLMSGKSIYVDASDPNSYLAHDGNFKALNTGNFIAANQTGGFVDKGNTGQLTNVFYPLNANPAGYVTSVQNLSGSYIFRTAISNGVSNQFIPFPANLDTGTRVVATLNNNIDNTVIPVQVSGIVSSGFYAVFSDVLGSGYSLDAIAALSTNTGLATTVIVNTTNTINVTSGIFASGSTSGAYAFRTQISSGVNLQFINFPVNLDNGARVIATLNNSIDNTILPFQISGIVSSGFYSVFANSVGNTGYFLDALASVSTNTGLATTVIINNFTTNNVGGTGTALQVTGSAVLTTGNLNTTNNITLSLDSQSNITIGSNTGAYGNFVNTNQTGNFITNAQTGVFATVTNLQSTGSYLASLISSSSAGVTSLGGLTGVIAISGAGNVSVIQSGNGWMISGNTGAYVNFINTNQTGNFITAAQTGGFLDGGKTGILTGVFALSSNTGNFVTTNQTGVFINRNGDVTTANFTSSGVEYFSAATLGLTNLDLVILQNTTAATTGTPSQNSPSLLFSGQGWASGVGGTGSQATLWRVYNSPISGVTVGSNLKIDVALNTGNYINFLTLSTTGVSGGYLLGNKIVTSVDTGNFISSSQTGAFYPLIGNPSGFVLSTATGNFVTLAQSGQLTGAFYPLNSNPSNYLISINTGSFITTGQTGIFYPLVGNPSNFVLSTQTGNFLTVAQTGVLTGVFASSNGTGNFVVNNQTGNFVTAAQTGVLSNTFIYRNGDSVAASFTFSGVEFFSATGLGVGYSDLIVLQNSTLATTGSPTQNSPSIMFSGQGWVSGAGGTGSQPVIWRIYNSPISGSILSSVLKFDAAVNTGLYFNFMTLSTTGNSGLYVNGNAYLSGNRVLTTLDSINFVLTSQTGNFVAVAQTGGFLDAGKTGVLSNVFYPLNSNPSNYLTSVNTGSFITTGQTGAFYPLVGNPSSFVLAANTGNFLTIAQTGILTGVFALSANTGNFVTTNQTGNFIAAAQTGGFLDAGKTGILTGVFASSNGTGNFVTVAQTGVFLDAGKTGQLTNVFYPLNSNPSGYISLSASGTNAGAYIFRTVISSGVSSQFVSFPAILDAGARVLVTLSNNVDNTVMPVQVSGIVSSGFYALFPDILGNGSYNLDALATISTATGLATTVINTTINNTYTGTPLGVNGASVIGSGNIIGVSNISVYLSGTSGIIISGIGLALTNQTGDFVTIGMTGGLIANVVNGGLGTGLFSGSSLGNAYFRGLIPGSGIQITGNGRDVTIDSMLGNTFISSLATNKIMVTANVSMDAISGTISAGTWLSASCAAVRGLGNSAMIVTSKLWNGTTVYCAQEEALAALGANVTGYSVIPLVGIFTVAAPTTVAISCTSTLANSQISSAPVHNSGVGLASGASTYINLVRLY